GDPGRDDARHGCTAPRRVGGLSTEQTGGRLPSTPVTDDADAERLVAEALRAQAVRAPLPDPARAEPPLLAGTHHLLAGRMPDARRRDAPVEQETARVARRPGSLPVGWIVLLAVLLGLAAGAVVGLVSIL